MKADSLSSKLSVAHSLPNAILAPFFKDRLKQLDMSLLTETALVTIASILVIKLIYQASITPAAWFAVPAIWVSAAIIPTAIKGRKLAAIGLTIKKLKQALLLVCAISVVLFPAMFFGLWVLGSYGLEMPLRPVPPKNQDWFCWLFYQFMYIAVAEEVFFRAYVQRNIQRLTNAATWLRPSLQQWLSISISAGCFAAAHIIVQGQITSALTFLPALICGWLFVKTRVLIAPILFHGLANTCYCVIAAVLA
ncbi:MAG: CPBP family intramembrane metalloprotease [Planctomycetota bacterium]|nr:MAG: CPBP family intramembrane metalloprotease [Planctomycetota bacterium]